MVILLAVCVNIKRVIFFFPVPAKINLQKILAGFRMSPAALDMGPLAAMSKRATRPEKSNKESRPFATKANMAASPISRVK